MGADDDGDCLEADRPNGAKDTNGNGVICDGILRKDWFGSATILWDNGVDEDPDDEAFIQEATHRAFLLGYGKLGVVFLLGIFLPLFLATGLIRGEMTSETMHFLLAKPIARGEVLLYRMLGYLTLVWPASAIVVFLSALVTGLAAPGEGFFRFEDLGIWLAILLATWLALLVYGMLFMSLGVMWKYGIVLAIPFAAWEFGMAFLSMGLPSSPLLRVSVIGWCLSIIDAATRCPGPTRTPSSRTPQTTASGPARSLHLANPWPSWPQKHRLTSHPPPTWPSPCSCFCSKPASSGWSGNRCSKARRSPDAASTLPRRPQRLWRWISAHPFAD